MPVQTTETIRMSTQATTDAVDEDLEFETRPRPNGLSGKKLVFLILLPLLLLIGGGGTAYVTGALDGFLGGVGQQRQAAKAGPSVFFELPELLVNLNSAGNKRRNYLKLRVSLELTDAQAVHHIKQVLPRIVDAFQVYLRELRIEDLQGSAGLYRLREELLLRVNAVAEPVEVEDVLFKEMLVQ